jgi:hypothetical protein
MKHFITAVIFSLVFAHSAFAAVLVLSPNGVYTTKLTLAAAATATDVAGKTVVVTSPQLVTTPIAWPADRQLKFEKGGYVTLSGSGTLTGLGDVRLEEFGAKFDGSDESIVLSAAITGSRKILPWKGTLIAESIALKSNTTIEGYGDSSILKLKNGSANRLLIGTGLTNMHLRNFKIDGNRALAAGVIGTLYLDNCSGSIENVNVLNGRGDDADSVYGGITLNNCTDMAVKNSSASGCWASGLKITGASTSNLVVDGGSYNSNTGSGVCTSLANDVVMTAVSAVGNTQSNISLNGLRNKAIGCTGTNSVSGHGINVGHPLLNASDSEVIGGNYSANGGNGVNTFGDGTTSQTGVKILGVTVKGNVQGIQIDQYTSKITVNGSVVNGNTSYGLNLSGQDITLNGNHVFGNTGGEVTVSATASRVKGTGNIIPGMGEGSGGLVVNASAKSVAFDGTYDTRISDTTIAGATSTAETDLKTLTLAGSTLNMRSGVRITAWGTRSGTAGNKTIKVYFGGVVYASEVDTNATQWHTVLEVFNANSLASQRYYGTVTRSGAPGAVYSAGGSSSVNTANDVVIKITGTVAVSGDSITQTALTVEQLGY